MLVYVVFGLIAAVPATIWVLYGADRFGWDALTIGASLSVFGVATALAQGLLVSPISKRFGDLGTLMIGVGFDAAAYLSMAFADQSWMGFAVAPLFAIGGLAGPALQSLLSGRVGPDKQGQLAGVLTSLSSLAAIGGPVLATLLYTASRDVWLGTVWTVAAALYVLATPLFLLVKAPRAAAA